MIKEEWRNIKGYEGKYQVSNLGRVKSLNYRQTGKEKIMNPGLLRKGYLGICLCKNGKQIPVKIHRLVAETFLPNPNNLPVINHIDENPANNRIDNLEFCTIKYNVDYSLAKQIGQFKNGKLVKVYNALNDTKKDGFMASAVCLCCKGKRNQHHGYEWKYLK